MTNSSLCIAHSVDRWLPLTEIWIYNQIKYAPQTRPIILAILKESHSRFTIEPLYFASKNEYVLKLYHQLRHLNILKYPPVFTQAVKEHRPQILHSHFGDRGWCDLGLAKRFRLKQIVTYYGYDVSLLPKRNPIWKERYARLFDSADLFLGEGPNMVNSLIQLGCPAEKVKVQRLGVALEHIPFQPRQLKEGEQLKILIASSFREKKGIPYALEAIGRLRQKYPNIAVTIIGDTLAKGKDQLEKTKIMEMMTRWQLQPITRMLGYQPYGALMKEAYDHHVFLAPSVTATDGDTEGGAPVVLADMAAAGISIVSSRHADIPQVVLNGQTGLLADERNAEQLTAHLEWFVTHPEEWGNMARRGRAHIEQNFDVVRQGILLSEIYRELAS